MQMQLAVLENPGVTLGASAGSPRTPPAARSATTTGGGVGVGSSGREHGDGAHDADRRARRPRSPPWPPSRTSATPTGLAAPGPVGSPLARPPAEGLLGRRRGVCSVGRGRVGLPGHPCRRVSVSRPGLRRRTWASMPCQMCSGGVGQVREALRLGAEPGHLSKAARPPRGRARRCRGGCSRRRPPRSHRAPGIPAGRGPGAAPSTSHLRFKLAMPRRM